VILTEWKEFSSLDLKKACDLVKHKKIIDLRNLIDKSEAIKLGFEYQGIGR
ncbi:UDP-glucose 6-dehydrogenase, partial [Campylobacter jejuni]|nr:UDP-glucose 6-dehydrogenase [Campylobacter jejuni]